MWKDSLKLVIKKIGYGRLCIVLLLGVVIGQFMQNKELLSTTLVQ